MKNFSKFVDIKDIYENKYLSYLVEAFPYHIKHGTGKNDIDALGEPWTKKDKTDLKKVFNFLIKSFPDIKVKTKGKGPISAGNAKESGVTFKINSAYANQKIGKKTFDAAYVNDLIKSSNLKFAKFGDGSPVKGDGDTSILADFDVSSSTEFFEFFQAIGFFVSSNLTENKKDFESILKSPKINGDFPMLVTPQTEWVKFIRALYANKELRIGVIELVNSSYFLSQKIKTPYIV